MTPSIKANKTSYQGVQKAYQKFQFYDRSQLNMNKFYGTQSKLKRVESDSDIQRLGLENQNQHISHLDMNILQSQQGDQSQYQDIGEQQKKQQTRNFNQLRKLKSDQLLQDTNFVSPRSIHRITRHQVSTSQNHYKEQIINGKKMKVLTFEINKNESQSKNMEKNLMFNKTKQFIRNQEALGTQNILNGADIDYMNFTGGYNVMKKSLSTKVLFNPPRKIKDILLDKNSSEKLQHQKLVQKYGNFKNSTILQSDESNFQQSIVKANDSMKSQYDYELSLPAIVQKSQIVQDENYASFQITKSRFNQQQSSEDYQDAQFSLYNLNGNKNPSKMTSLINDKRFLNKISQQHTMKLFNLDRQLSLQSLGKDQEQNLPQTHRQISVQPLDSNSSQNGIKNIGKIHLSEGKHLRMLKATKNTETLEDPTIMLNLSSQNTVDSHVIKSVHIEEFQSEDFMTRDSSRNKILKKLHDQVKSRLNKYKNGAQLISGMTQAQSSKDLWKMFNLTANIEGPYQNNSLKMKHNNLKQKLRRKTQSNQNNQHSLKQAKNQDDKDLTLAIDEIIYTSKNLEVKSSPKGKQYLNNLSQIMEQNRSLRNSPKKDTKSSQQLSTLDNMVEGNFTLLVNQTQQDNKAQDGNSDIKREQETFIKTLTQTFTQKLHNQECDIVFDIFQKTPQERTNLEDQRVIDYLYSLSIFKDFPSNLIKEISRKFTAQILKRDEIIKYKSDDCYQIILKGKILKIDPKQNFQQAKILLNTLYDPTEYLNKQCILMVKKPSNTIQINKKELAKCIKIASLRQGAEDDLQFLAKAKFFKRLSKDTLQQLCNLLVPRLLEEGKKIYDIGDVSEEMFIVRSGSVVEEVKVKNQNQSDLNSQSQQFLQSTSSHTQKQYFEFAEYKQGDWFGQSEMMLSSNRKSRVTATQNTLLLCIRRYELHKVLGFEYFELLKMHIFDHEDLQNRMKEVSKSSADSSVMLKKYKHFDER